MTKNYNMITCDGGGIRGLMSAKLINDLVSNPPSGSSSDILSNVSLFAGTSTGGIIAIGLACGVAPSLLVSLYENKCKKIFQAYQPNGTTSSAVSRLQSASPQPESVLCDLLPEDFCYVKYTDMGLYEALKATLSAKVNPDNALSTLSAGVLVTTFMMLDANTDPWSPLALTNLPNSKYGGVSIIDAAMCSAAAPIYFPPYPLELTGEPAMRCADGGVFANNPSTYALANVLGSQVLGQSMTLSNVMLLSIGTGANVDTVPPKDFGKSTDWGIFKWLDPLAVPPEPVYPLMAAMFDAQSQMADFEAGNILGSSQYRRANPPLSQTINLDGCGSISTLVGAANTYINSQEWIDIKQWAYHNFV